VAGSDGVATLGDPEAVLRAGSDGSFVVTHGGRTVSVVGVPDAVVVDTPDAVLVTTRAHAQDVKAAVDAWRARGREDLL
jgi:mannose-1-phosphate guanylyltransferase